MLVLSRKLNEQIRIGANVTITILRVKGNAVRIGVEAPRSVRVVRGELPPKTDDSPIVPSRNDQPARDENPQEDARTDDPLQDDNGDVVRCPELPLKSRLEYFQVGV